MTSKHWFHFIAQLYFHRQLPSLHTISHSSQGVITQPSKYQNMLWFETWCTESQAPEWLWFTSKFKKILSFVSYLFTICKHVWSVVKLSIGKCTKKRQAILVSLVIHYEFQQANKRLKWWGEKESLFYFQINTDVLTAWVLTSVKNTGVVSHNKIKASMSLLCSF